MPDFVPFLHIHNIVPDPVALLNIPTIVSLIYRDQELLIAVQDLENVSLPCVHILSLLGILRQPDSPDYAIEALSVHNSHWLITVLIAKS